jgi:3-methyl-2-oxobutanoate hydroxymethyltransferase
MVIGGHATTLPVTIDQMVYHTRCVAAGAKAAYINAARLMAAGAPMVKLEGGAWLAPTIEFLVTRGIPVCGHIGLQPQSAYRFGGSKAQGKTDESARELFEDARALVAAGIALLVLEMIPSALGAELTREFAVPTRGVGFTVGGSTIEAAVVAYVKAVKDGSFPGPEHSI